MNNKHSHIFREAIDLYRAGNFQQSVAKCESLIKKKCKDENILCLLVDNYMNLGNYNAASAQLKNLVKLKPQNANYKYMLASVYLKLGKFVEALKFLKLSVKINAANGDAWSLLSGTAGQLGNYNDAISAGIKATAILPKSLSANMNLATAYDALNFANKALESYKVCADIEPDNPVVQCKLGDIYIANNNKEKAEACYRKSISIDPCYTPAYRQIARLIKYTSIDHDDFIQISSVLNNNRLTDRAKSNLHFALGKMYEDCGLYDDSFQHYKKGNVIEDSFCDFSKTDFTNMINEIQSFFNSDFFDNCTISGSLSDVPIFIIGMPRSGTTLIEQIIASHPDCYGAGELPWFGEIEKKLNDALQTNNVYPQCVASMSNAVAGLLASEYLSYIEEISGSKRYKKITDKLPGNFIHIGLISMLFPNARFIHCKRNPLDTCFSIYSILFPGSMDFSHNLENIASVYNDYHRLMLHWQNVLADKILTVEYEDIITNQQEETERIIDFIGLDWDANCLNFHKNTHSVKTVSAFQVRKGLYKSSINRWKNYQNDLQPLYNALDKELIDEYNI